MRCTTLLLAVLLYSPALAHADLIRFATGYPDTSFTENQVELANSTELGPGGAWSVAGIRLSLATPTEITGLAAIGNTIDSNWADFAPDLNIHSSETAFANDGLNGDVYQAPSVSFSTPLALGTQSADGSDNYYVTFSFEPFVLSAGNFILSVPIGRAGGFWSWTESSIDLGSDISTNDASVGTYFVYEDFPQFGFTTGTAALDVMGTIVPEPSAVLLFGVGAIGLLKRKRH